MKIKVKSLIIISLFSSLLMASAWYPFMPGIVLLIAFVPLILMTETMQQHSGHFGNSTLFIMVLPGLLVFNTAALFWIRIAGVPLMITAIAANTFIMALSLWLAWLISKKSGMKSTALPVVVLWLAMEYLTNNIPLLSPWLNLGNALAKETSIIQWYEFTGIAGGTLWILVVNFLLAKIIITITGSQQLRLSAKKLTVILIITIITPPLLSLLRERSLPVNAGEKIEVVILQPNIDPWSEKFSTPFSVQLQQLLDSADASGSQSTRWFIAPETFIGDTVRLESLSANLHIEMICHFLASRPNSLFLTGAVTVSGGNPATMQNSAIMLSALNPPVISHKAKLVPGIEKRFDGPFRLLQKLFPNLGGTRTSYAGATEYINMPDPFSKNSAAPVICFESAFGEHVARHVREGATFLAVITNDGWWKGTNGYYQHLLLSRLRAIETRRPVVRSANTGVSAIINIRGHIEESLPWWESGTIRSEITPEERITFYVKTGDLTGRVASTISLFLIVIHLVAIPLRRKIGL